MLAAVRKIKIGRLNLKNVDWGHVALLSLGSAVAVYQFLIAQGEHLPATVATVMGFAVTVWSMLKQSPSAPGGSP